MLYTRKGDGGSSGLFGTKERFPKDSPVYEALGTIDELNSLLGVCRAFAQGVEGAELVGQELLKTQECLFIVQAEIAGAPKFVTENQVSELETAIQYMENNIQPINSFVIPGSTAVSALCDYARAVSRRAERRIIALQPERNVNGSTLAYMNRLSSLLYALARYSSAQSKAVEQSPSYNN